MNKGKLFHISASFYARDEDPPNVARGLVRFWTPEAIQEVTEAVSAAERSSFRVLHATTAIPRTYLVCAIMISTDSVLCMIPFISTRNDFAFLRNKSRITLLATMTFLSSL
ncbi:hypothetical protein GN244_ATG09325 [Phytophthora infestans]|uniref:Uncharacterized protein n=1 Tax=Phytophthora infestans TaxID=4787 RepID=A0A833SV09_PHYIN|nr:hypothetical protein GN244_ATG09325 [Phytophthora infestans]